MSYATVAPAYTLFPTATTSPNAFSIFAASQSPRDTYAMYDDLRQVLRPSNGQTGHRSRTQSRTSSLKKFLRA
ncbi:hypothetical protein A0H81_09942 [Grifola frondosa]|uniref:Uncharacterized protein n=1 Tax=Grifola frondosa TaxID=5627 RepID=A0A1C7M0Y7_GRIFR|nr:hypothetical protein A0H81_09942 [Grifola frondosa]